MPLKGKTKHDIVTEFRNAEILEAARKVFAKNGFSGTSVEAIAQEAGIAKGTLYLYYSSKQEIYWASLKNGLVALCSELRQQVEAARTVEDKIRAFVETKLLFFEQHKDFFKIYHAEFGNAIASPAPAGFFELLQEQLRMLKDILLEGSAQKKVRDMALEPTAFAIFDVTRGAITQRLLGYSQLRIQEEIDFLCDFIWKGIACL
jgi:TetR/AcrR family fatty acid metabolism transcriptional regulator